MKVIPSIALVALLCLQIPGSHGQFGIFNFPAKVGSPCDKDPLPQFKEILYEFTSRITRSSARYYNDRNFVISPFSMWLSMASIAEYSEKNVQRELFNALMLPAEKCVRDKLYHLAINLEVPGPDVLLTRNRMLAIDEGATINENWAKFTTNGKILAYSSGPVDLQSFQHAQSLLGVNEVTSKLEGNSYIVDRLAYEASWSSAFEDGKIDSGPFYDKQGQPIGTVDYMVMKKKVKLAYIPIIDAKVLELPVGKKGRYSLLFTMGVSNELTSKILEFLQTSVIVQMLSALAMSVMPLDIAIPVFSVTTGVDAKPLLEDVGLNRVFTDPAASRYVSDPAALPAGYLQRIAVNITNASLKEPEVLSNYNDPIFGIASVFKNTASSVVSIIGRNFVANRPFIFSLIDNKTKVTIFTGVYSYPENTSNGT